MSPENDLTRLPGPEGEFPKNPTERFAAILPAIANHPGKQILMILLEENPQTALDLLTQMQKITEPQWSPSMATTYAYCRKSLIPAGLAAEEPIARSDSTNNLVGFSSTRAGRLYGQPVAAFILERSYHNAFGGRPYFWSRLGKTSSPTEVKAPLLRARLLATLAQNPLKWHTDTSLYQQIGLKVYPNTMSHVTDKLSKLGLVEKQSVNNEDPRRVKYHLINPIDQSLSQITQKYAHWSRKVLLPKIVEALSSSEALSAIEIGEKTGSQAESVHRTLGFLLERNIIEPAQLIVGVRRGMDTKMSQVKITRLGLKFADDLAIIERALAGGPEIREIERTLRTFKSNPETLKRIAARAVKEWVETSIVGKMKSAGERKEKILDYLAGKGSARAKDIFRDLKIGKNFSLLSELVSEKKLRREKVGKKSYYSLRSSKKR